MKFRYAIVLPVYNEEATLEKAVLKVRGVVKGMGCEIIIAEDGSTDATAEIAARLGRKYGDVTALHSPKKLGRGRALKRAFEKARALVVAYMDSDLSTDLAYVKPLLAAADKCDVVTGSRYAPGSDTRRDESRFMASACFNFLVRLLLGSRLYDHQCGFKAFKKKGVIELDRLAESNGWFWDTEVLVLAQKKGMAIEEIPVRWAERREGTSKVSILRDSAEMLGGILSMRLRLWKRGIIR